MPGIILDTQSMPCQPSEIHVGGHYFLKGSPGTLRIPFGGPLTSPSTRCYSLLRGLSQEQEEVVVRILVKCQEARQWVGINEKDLQKEVKSDMENARRAKYDTAYQQWVSYCRWYFWLMVLTFGVSRWFLGKPKNNFPSKENYLAQPMKGSLIIRYLNLVSAPEALVDLGYLKKAGDEDHPGQASSPVAFFLTPKLVESILEAQKEFP